MLDLQIEMFADDTKYMSPLIQAWYSDEKTQMIYDASMTWMEAKEGATDCYFLATSFDLTKKEVAKQLKFPKAFEKGSTPEIAFWLKGFRFSSDSDKPYQFEISPSKVSNKGLTANVEASENCERIDITMIAYAQGKKKTARGTFGTDDAEGRKANSAEANGKVQFPEGRFTKAPTVLSALRSFDLAGGRDLRIGVDIKDVTKDGFAWTLRKYIDCRRTLALLTLTQVLGVQSLTTLSMALKRRMSLSASLRAVSRYMMYDALTVLTRQNQPDHGSA